jgi:hypothetical protein
MHATGVRPKHGHLTDKLVGLRRSLAGVLSTKLRFMANKKRIT